MRLEDLRVMVLGIVPGADVVVSDMTGTLDHFQVTVVSPTFEGRSLVERHQLVQGPLKPLIDDGRIHALSLKTLTPAQAAKGPIQLNRGHP
jgi:acid stress-induced BolA-like protein IbaG/YrbA